MTISLRKVLLGLLGAAVLAPAITAHAAEPARRRWAAKHPRRAEVVARERRQHARIREGVRSGELTKAEAQQLRTQEKAIRQEKREMVADDGRLDRGEYRELNKDLNETSKDIYREKHDADQR